MHIAILFAIYMNRVMCIVLIFQMTVDPSGIGFDLNVPVEVVIGSIPFSSIAQQYGFNVQQTIEPPPPGAPEGLYSDPNAGQAPGVSMPNMRKWA